MDTTATTEPALMADAERRAAQYIAGSAARRSFPGDAALAALTGFDAPLPDQATNPAETLDLLDRLGSPATVGSNGPRYFGFVIGAALPVAAAADRLVSAWDQNASSHDSSPASAAIERIAAKYVLDVLDLPRESAVGFGTGATACTIAALSAARRAMLARAGWDFDRDGLVGAPEIRVVVSQISHITVYKALRLLGFGSARLILAETDQHGRVDPARLPLLDDRTILILQAGEVNTGEFDPFAAILPVARAAGAWVHVDGAFGLWARASSRRALTAGIDLADSWTTDGHKWLNTPYDGAMTICRDGTALAQAMNSDAAYFTAAPDAQKNLTLEFSRRPRGVAIWAALRTLGRQGVADLVDRHCDDACHLAARLTAAGFDVINRVVINQVLIRCATDAETLRVRAAVLERGHVWFSPTTWQGKPAMRISISSWRTTRAEIDLLADELVLALR